MEISPFLLSELDVWRLIAWVDFRIYLWYNGSMKNRETKGEKRMKTMNYETLNALRNEVVCTINTCTNDLQLSVLDEMLNELDCLIDDYVLYTEIV